MRTFKWGILGAGRIARKFASDLKYVEGGELASAVQQLCRIVGLHYGEPSFTVDSPDELVERRARGWRSL